MSRTFQTRTASICSLSIRKIWKFPVLSNLALLLIFLGSVVGSALAGVSINDCQSLTNYGLKTLDDTCHPAGCHGRGIIIWDCLQLLCCNSSETQKYHCQELDKNGFKTSKAICHKEQMSYAGTWAKITEDRRELLSGRIDFISCSDNRFQPERKKSSLFLHNRCDYPRSQCRVDKGLRICRKGNSTSDDWCSCDHRRNMEPKIKKCSCFTQNDPECPFSCKRARCPPGMALNSDYKCATMKSMTSDNSQTTSPVQNNITTTPWNIFKTSSPILISSGGLKERKELSLIVKILIIFGVYFTSFLFLCGYTLYMMGAACSIMERVVAIARHCCCSGFNQTMACRIKFPRPGIIRLSHYPQQHSNLG